MSCHDLRITLVQHATIWCDPEKNRKLLSEQLASLARQTDVIILPETFTSGFNAQAPQVLETMQGPSVAWMRDQAARLNAVVTGSLPIRTDQGVFNRLIWAMPDDHLAYYDKRHLFRYAGEHQRYQAGRERLVTCWRGWRIQPFICYDLRFPVFCRNRYRPGEPEHYDVDVQIFVANWPSARATAWKTLLRARAIENQCYVAGVNRVGHDGHGLQYAGGSMVVTMQGEVQLEMGSSPHVVTTVLDRQALTGARADFPVMVDADAFTLTDQAHLL